MKRTKLFIILLSILVLGTLINSSAGADTDPDKKVYYEPTWESLMRHEATPQWYEDAVLGFYFHWGHTRCQRSVARATGQCI